MPQMIDLAQGSPDWLAWREKGLGASDTPIVLEESPWMSAYQLWQQKAGLVKAKPPSAAMDHGRNSEETARLWYVQQTGVEVAPATAVYSDAEFIRASVDGWNAETRHLVEIKCPTTIEGFRKAKEGEIPVMYELQMFHEMEVMDAASCEYVCWFNGDGVIIPVQRNTDLWCTEILPQLEEFWRRVQAKEWPVPQGMEVNESTEWKLAADNFLAGKRRMREGEDMKRGGEAAMRRLATAKTTTGAGVKAIWYNVKPRWEIVIKAESEAASNAILKALEPLQSKAGVKDIKTRPYPPNMWLKVMEDGEE